MVLFHFEEFFKTTNAAVYGISVILFQLYDSECSYKTPAFAGWIPSLFFVCPC